MYEMMRTYFQDQKRSKILEDRLQAGLSDDQRNFLEAAEIGNLDVVKELLGSGKVKVDCCDQQGRTALEMAVTGNDVEIVAYLLERASARHIHKALLAAADNDMERICELILDHPLYRESVRRFSARQAAELAGLIEAQPMEEQDNRFSHANLSKLLLEVLLRAAKRNNFMIVKKIMMCGVFLEEPHDYFCACDECTEGRREDFKVYTTRRLDTFTALASPAYISLTAEDPIMAAFNLSVKFRRLSELEGEYKQIYNQLDQQVQNYTLAILDQCQSSEEVKAVLSGKMRGDEEEGGAGGGGEFCSRGSGVLPLVYTAARMNQKKFVAHPQCQAQIGQMWYSGVPFLRYLNRFGYLMLAIPVGMLCCPILSIAYLISPWSKVSRIVNTPLMKFLSYTCSYLTFLTLIIVAKLYLRHYFESLSCEKPETFAYVIVTLVFMFIFGMIFEECKQIFKAGARDYFASIWNVIDSIMLSLLLASFVVELITPLRLSNVEWHDDEHKPGGHLYVPPSLQNTTPSSSLNYLPSPGSGGAPSLSLVSVLFTASHPPSPICLQSKKAASMSVSAFCAINTPPKIEVVWEWTWVPDPQLLSDVLFSLGIIFSISRFSFIMPANEALGTMLVSFMRTVNDIVKIFGMFLLVLLAFTCGLAALYAPSRCLTDSFGSFSTTLSTLTWSMFGMGSKADPMLHYVAGQDRFYSLTNHPEKPEGAATVGHYLYGVYVFCTMVVLLNLLIAVMSNSFQEVQDERDVEWKFARTELWLTFIAPGTPVFPPFNIVPSPRHVWKAVMWLCRRSKFKHLLPHGGKKVRYVAVQTGSDMELQDFEERSENSSVEGTRTRNDVICLLIRRYIRHTERAKTEGEEGEAANIEDIFRRMLDRMSAKFEKKLDDINAKVFKLQNELTDVRAEGKEGQVLNKTHYDEFVDFSGKKTSETDRYAFLLDEAKLQILSRMDSERIQMERVLEHRVGALSRRLDDSTTQLSQQVDRLQGIKTPSMSPKHKW